MRSPLVFHFNLKGSLLAFVVGQVCQEKTLSFCLFGNVLLSPLSLRNNFVRSWIFHWQFFFFLSSCISYLTAFWASCFQIGYQTLIFLRSPYDKLLVTFKFPSSALAGQFDYDAFRCEPFLSFATWISWNFWMDRLFFIKFGKFSHYFFVCSFCSLSPAGISLCVCWYVWWCPTGLC